VQTKKSETPTARATTTSVLMAGLIVMSTIAAAASIIMLSSATSASAQQNTDGKDIRCLPRSEFNGRENAGNEHFDGDGSFDQSGNPHDPGTPKGNPHDRCAGS
jgi:hypothetical protein